MPCTPPSRATPRCNTTSSPWCRPKGSPAQQVVAAAAAQQDAVGVMKSIMALGVPAERIHLGVRSDSEIGANQVRVYVR